MDIENSLITIESDQQLTTELAELAKLTLDYAKKAKSKNTHKAYRNDWKDFEFWCKQKNLQAMPAAPHTVAAYLADRATNSWIDSNNYEWKPLKVSTIIRRLTAISQAHIMAKAAFDRKHPVIKETLKGIQNTLGMFQTRKEPILIEELRKMIECLPIVKDGKPYLQGIRNRALLLIGFAGAFRRSEIVALNVNDLKWQKEGILITIRRSKTDQAGKGREVAIPYGSNPITCPVRALREWLSVAGISEGPIFRSINRHGQIGTNHLSDHSVALIIKSNPLLSGWAKDFSGHSLRAGFTTTAAKAGAPEHMIMRQTGHKKSDTIKKYIRIGTIWQENAAYKIGL